MKRNIFFFCLLLSITHLYAMEKTFQEPMPLETEVLKTMWEVNSLTGRSKGLASHISMTNGIHHFPLFAIYFYAAEHNISEGITALSMPQEDPTREAKLFETLAQLRQSKDNLSPIVKKMEAMIRRKIVKQALSHQTSLEQAAQALIDHVNNAPN